MTANDLDLLGEFTRDQSQDAFTALVRRHLDLVYCAALRQVRSPELAEEVAQSVFTDLARNAARLNSDTILTAWLYQVTRRTAIDLVRGETRRQLREQIASEMNAMNANAADWTQIEPLLDEAMHALDQTDRTAVLLRYFENKSLREVGQSLGTTDDAAQKRVSRAVERLREFFIKRGVTIGASGLVVVISANAVQAAPIGLSVAIAATAALAGTTTATAASATTTKAIVMTTLQKTLISATLVIAVGTGIYEALQVSRLRNQVQTVQQQQIEQIQQLTREREDATNQLAALRNENERLNRNTAELLKLRGEVGVLRRQQREVERTATATPSGRAGLSSQTASIATEQANRPPPFQLQLVLEEPGEDSEVVTNNTVNAGDTTLNVRKTPLLDHTAISSVTVTTSAAGAPQIDVELSQAAREQFAQITKENINKRLAIVMDGNLYSAPVIKSEISGGKLQISGPFTAEEARELATKINDAISNR